MSRLDWVILGFAALSALAGLRRGLLGTLLSVAGVVAGAVVGARTAGWHGAVAGAAVGQVAAAVVRRLLRLVLPLRLVDSLGGFAAGAAWGLALAWVAAAVVVELPGHPGWRREVRSSQVIRRLDELAPPRDLLRLYRSASRSSTAVGTTMPGTSLCRRSASR